MKKAEQSSISASELTKALAVLAAVLILFDLAGGRILRGVYAQSTVNPIARAVMSKPETVILGSSTAKYGLDPAAMGAGVYNAAENGQALFYAAAFLRNLPANSGIKRIVLGIDLPDVAMGYKSSNMKYLRKLAPLAGSDTSLRKQIGTIDPFVEFKFFSGLYPFQGVARRVVFEWLWPIDAGNGYTPLAETMNRIPKTRKWSDSIIAMPDESAAEFLEIVELSKKNRIQLVVVSPPWAAQPYLQREDEFRDIVATIRSVMEQNGVCDLTREYPPELEAVSQNPSLFKDRDHLNGHGARVYGKIVSQMIGRKCPPIGAPETSSRTLHRSSRIASGLH